MSIKKKICIFFVIIFIVVLSIIGLFKLRVKDTKNNDVVVQEETLYKYKIIDNEDEKQIKLIIDSKSVIDSIKFPDGRVEKYNEKSITVSYKINGNGVYIFFVTYKDGTIKAVHVTVNSIGSKIEVEDESTLNKVVSVNKSYMVNKLSSVDVSVLSPEGNITFSKNMYDITNQNILVSIIDNLNGRYQVEYQINNGEWNAYVSSIEVDKNCVIHARYRYRDIVGPAISFNVDNIDKVSPKIKLNNNSENCSDIVVGIEVEDASNTINYYYWSEDANLEEIPKKKRFKSGQEVSLSGINGNYYLYVMSTDIAGNRTIMKSDLFNINVDGPEIMIDVDGTDSYVKNVSVIPTITDLNQPVTTYYAWSKNRKTAEFSEENKVESGQAISLDYGDGVYFLHLKSVDAYGNETYFKSNIYYMDNTAPGIENVDLKIGGVSLSISIEAADNYSKSLKYYYSLDDINYIESGNNYIFTGLSKYTEYTLYYKVIDEAGNEVIDSKKVMTLNCSYDIGASFDFGYTGASQSLVRSIGEVCPGEYKIELWGAQGGYRSSSYYGGKGGYATATIFLSNDLYIYVGASGNTGGTSGGWNGGGSRHTYSGGGGATDIRTVDNGTDWSNTTGLNSRLLVAGGGGSDGAKSRNGGAGGGTTGESMTQSYGSGGGGGTQTSGGYGGSNNSGTFGRGGTGLYRANGYGGAGGGGWYGGGGTYPDGSADDDRGGGGGSGFALTSTATVPSSYLLSANDYALKNISLISGYNSLPSPNGGYMYGKTGNGYARVTYLG